MTVTWGSHDCHILSYSHFPNSRRGSRWSVPCIELQWASCKLPLHNSRPRHTTLPDVCMAKQPRGWEIVKEKHSRDKQDTFMVIMLQQNHTLSNSTHCHKAAVGQVDMLQNNRFMSVPHSLSNMASGCYCIHAENTHSTEHSGPPPLPQVKRIPLKLRLCYTLQYTSTQCRGFLTPWKPFLEIWNLHCTLLERYHYSHVVWAVLQQESATWQKVHSHTHQY